MTHSKYNRIFLFLFLATACLMTSGCNSRTILPTSKNASISQSTENTYGIVWQQESSVMGSLVDFEAGADENGNILVSQDNENFTPFSGSQPKIKKGDSDFLLCWINENKLFGKFVESTDLGDVFPGSPSIHIAGSARSFDIAYSQSEDEFVISVATIGNTVEVYKISKQMETGLPPLNIRRIHSGQRISRTGNPSISAGQLRGSPNYLVTYQFSNSIRFMLLDENGAIGSDGVISTGFSVTDQKNTYDPIGGRYIVVFQNYVPPTSSGANIYSNIIFADGTLAARSDIVSEGVDVTTELPEPRIIENDDGSVTHIDHFIKDRSRKIIEIAPVTNSSNWFMLVYMDSWDFIRREIVNPPPGRRPSPPPPVENFLVHEQQNIFSQALDLNGRPRGDKISRSSERITSPESQSGGALSREADDKHVILIEKNGLTLVERFAH